MSNWNKNAAIAKYLPKGKKELSIDAVELLLGLIYDQALQDVRDAEKERNRKPQGPYEIE